MFVSVSETTNKPAARFKLFSLRELDALPAPAWLVKGVIEMDSMSVIFGPTNEGKTFVTLDLALSIATGRDWHGHRVNKGPVIYMAGEGASHIRLRAKAWERHHDEEAGAFFMVRNAVQLRNPIEREEFINEVRRAGTQPSLIIIDTLARAFVGGDENSAKDMGEFVDAARKLQTELKCAVLLVHHSGKRTNNRKDPSERGSSALRAAVDTMIRVSTDKGIITFDCEKQKDAEKFKPLSFKLHDINHLGKNEDGEDLKSAVVVASDAYIPPATMDHKREIVLRVLAGHPEMTATRATWRGETETQIRGGIPNRTFDQIREDLEELGYVKRVKKGVYRVTAAGAATAKNLQSTATVQLPHPAATAHPLEGGAVQEGFAAMLPNNPEGPSQVARVDWAAVLAGLPGVIGEVSYNPNLYH